MRVGKLHACIKLSIFNRSKFIETSISIISIYTVVIIVTFSHSFPFHFDFLQISNGIFVVYVVFVAISVVVGNKNTKKELISNQFAPLWVYFVTCEKRGCQIFRHRYAACCLVASITFGYSFYFFIFFIFLLFVYVSDNLCFESEKKNFFSII